MTTSRRTSARTPDKPAPRAKTFDLDKLEKDRKAPKPLPVRVNGEEFIFHDVDDVDWRKLREIHDSQDIDLQLRAMLGDEQYDRFCEHDIPGWKVEALMTHLDEHFGWSARMGEQGEEIASSTS